MILVTGADGFVGRHLLRALGDRNIAVRGLILPANTPPFQAAELEWVAGDLRDPASLGRALEGVETVVHLAAIVANADMAVNMEVNAEGTKSLLEQCGGTGVSHFIFVSAAAAKFKSANAYGRSKKLAEEYVRGGSLSWTILRTPLIIGRGGEEYDRFVDYVGKIPFLVPVFGNGQARKSPVHIDDVVAGLMAIVDGDAVKSPGRTFELASRGDVTLDRFIDIVCESLGKRKLKVHVPMAVSLLLAGLAEKIMGDRAPVTRDIIMGLNEDVEFDVDQSLRTLGLDPLDVAEAVRRG